MTAGPALRTDLVDVYVFRRGAALGGDVELLQLRRTRPPAAGTWHPVMGHVENGEAAIATAIREAREETGADRAAIVGFWALEQVHPFFVPELDAILLSPRFAIEVARDWRPRLDAEHDAWRWVRGPAWFLWPGQRRAVEEIRRTIVPAGATADALRLDLG